MAWATNEQLLACERYKDGIAKLSKNDMFGNFTGQAFIDFARAFRMALTSFGDWDGTPEKFDQMFSAIYSEPAIAAEFKVLIDSADALEKGQSPPKPINLENALKLKALCDGYFGSRIRVEFQKAVQRQQT